MQWLIDIIAEKVIEEIGIPPVYIDRGDPVDHDFEKADLTINWAFHELDLSAIIPAGASAVHLRVFLRSDDVGDEILFRKNSNVRLYAVSTIVYQVTQIILEAQVIVPLDNDRKIAYAIWVGGWTHIGLTVLGWWL